MRLLPILISESQRALSLCSSYCNVFYISRIEAHQKGDKRKECNPIETDVSGDSSKNYKPNVWER